MKISELKSRQGNVEVEGVIEEIEEPRSFNKYGRELRVANAVLKDNTGTVKLTLWNDDVSRFKQGDKVKVSNGYVNEFQGEMQLTSGKFGKMEKLGNVEVDEKSELDVEDESLEDAPVAPVKKDKELKEDEETEEEVEEELEESDESEE